MVIDGYRERAGAKLSQDRRYRWVLYRSWASTPHLGWIMLNPSTADATEDDPTIRRCIGFAQREGYGGIYVANLFGLRATDPSELADADDPVGRDTIGKGALNADGTPHYYDPWDYLVFCVRDVVVAWGAAGDRYAERVAEVVSLGDGWPMLCLGTTKDGHPRHPLYVRGDQPLEPWSLADSKHQRVPDTSPEEAQ